VKVVVCVWKWDAGRQRRVGFSGSLVACALRLFLLMVPDFRDMEFRAQVESKIDKYRPHIKEGGA
jgi:hypothetical protein